MTIPLNATTAPRASLPVNVLQFGGGRFLRGFVDWMIQVANDSGQRPLGVAIVRATANPGPGLGPLARQDGRYHVVIDGEPTLVTCVQRVVDAHTQFDAYRELWLGEDLEFVVSNTTEAGIVWAADDLSVRPPESFPAKVAAGLYDRFRHFDGDPARGLDVLCCELIEDNATRLRDLVLRHARAASLPDGFAAWIERCCRFHDTLVDRIVTDVPGSDVEAVQARTGFADDALVAAEPYHLWAIAGDPGLRDRLPLDRAGLNVQFVTDLAPSRTKKVRVLNGCHTVLAALGPSQGVATVADAVRHPYLSWYLDRLLATEILPTLAGDPDENRAYAATTLARFTLPGHALASIALHAFTKWGTRVGPTVRDAWAAGRDAPLSVFTLAVLLATNPLPPDFPDLPGLPDLPANGEPSDTSARPPLDDYEAWTREVIDRLGYDVDADRLAAETAAHLRAIVTDGLAASQPR